MDSCFFFSMERSVKRETLPIYRCNDRNEIANCASIVRCGGVIVFPTDTVYGIGCSPYNDRAVERVFQIKGRNRACPFPVLAANLHDIEKIVSLGKIGRKLASVFWPGGLTLVCKIENCDISKNVRAGQSTIGVRIPNNECVIGLLKYCRYLVGTSANVSGMTSPRSVSEILSSSLRGFDAVLDGGSTKEGQESTIIDISRDFPQIIREGAIPLTQIKSAVSEELSKDS